MDEQDDVIKALGAFERRQRRRHETEGCMLAVIAALAVLLVVAAFVC